MTVIGGRRSPIEKGYIVNDVKENAFENQVGLNNNSNSSPTLYEVRLSYITYGK